MTEATTAATKPKKRIALWLGIPALLLVIGVMAFTIFEPIQVLPRMRLGPGYSLVDQSAEPFSSEDVRGDVVLYTFGYSGCDERCDHMDSTVREVRSRLDEIDLGDVDVRFVTMTFDPSNDSPDVIADLASTKGAEGDQWRFVTGDPDHMENVLRSGFRVWYEPKDDGSFSFDPTLILVDGWGVIRGEYRYQTLASDADKIIRHLDVLAEEVRNSKGAASIAYEAAHFFLCYP